MARHASMDGPSSELRPRCEIHKKTFRSWKAAKTHQVTSPGRCVLVTVMVKTR